ncbi:organic solute transporter subunit beta [Sceloporus undulatus]|uniref:organic solute transporter subunit beta n=1 Tax=Sceloporus undulatus TaxID=8520 RepID=UPI001C4C557A|nr:organic solute transporter subunit beta [Sceloporus undulatus]
MKTFWTMLCFIVYVNIDISGPSVLALTNSQSSDNSENTAPDSMKDGIPPEKLEELLWFFRREDPSTWSYCILGLSFLVLVIGVALLGANIRANRARKISLLAKEEYRVVQPAETEMKQAFVLLKEESNPDPLADSLLPATENAGQVTIQWKDGNVTTLYEDKAEADI